MGFWKIIACVGAIATLGFVLCQIVAEAHGTVFGFLPITMVAFELVCAVIIRALSPKTKLPNEPQKPLWPSNATTIEAKTVVHVEEIRNSIKTRSG